jgi:hypothetical protein
VQLIETRYYWQVENGEIVANSRQTRPSQFGTGSSAEYLADHGYYTEREDRPERPGEFYDQTSSQTVNYPYVDVQYSWVEWTPERKREALGADIYEQVPDTSVRDNVRDNGREADISRHWGAAADKMIELQNTADSDLDTFDTTLDVAPASSGKGYARFTVSIKPTAGGDYSIEMVLKIETDYEDQGADARATIVDAPIGSGATLTFTQDADDSQIWRITPDYLKTNFGYSWADPELPATLELRWGAGSLVVSPRLTTERLDDRKAALVRYGVASTRGRSKSK